MAGGGPAARTQVRQALGRHAYPGIVDFVDELPKTETGKVRRNLLRGSR
jgi:acetyl-CoA synthetase